MVSFEDFVAVLGRAFGLELSVVRDTAVFEVAGEGGDTKVKVLVQNLGERSLVLMRTMLEANNLFGGTAGATLALDAATGRFRLQKYESPDELANDARSKVESFIETALFWSRAIADFRPPDEEPGGAPGDVQVMHV